MIIGSREQEEKEGRKKESWDEEVLFSQYSQIPDFFAVLLLMLEK